MFDFIQTLRREKDSLKTARSFITTLYQAIEMLGARYNSSKTHDFTPTLEICL